MLPNTWPIRRASLAIMIAVICVMAAAVIVFPEMGAKRPARIVVWLLLAVVLVGRSLILARPDWRLALLVLTGCLIFPLVALSRAFGQLDLLVLAVQLDVGVVGSTLTGFGSVIIAGFLSVGLLVLSLYWLGQVLQLGPWVIWTGILFLLCANPVSIYALRLIPSLVQRSDLVAGLAEPEMVMLTARPDVAMIYLEGLERGFADVARRGNVYAGVAALQARGVDFTGVRQVAGTGWSIAGIVASQCGLPLLPNSLEDTNRHRVAPRFLAHHRCLPDILRDNGYVNAAIVGGPNVFGGQGYYFASHGVSRITALPDMSDLFGADAVEAAYTGRVVDDQMVFDAALGVYDDLRTESAPIFLTVQTFGPHGHKSLLSRNCTDDGRAVLVEDLTASATCLVANLQLFLEGLEARRGARPTVVVILSDHLNHNLQMGVRPLAERANTVTFVSLDYDSSLAQAGAVVPREGTMMDVFPTLLAYLGGDHPEMHGGLGRPLFGMVPTLAERLGQGRLDRALFPNGALRAAITAAPPCVTPQPPLEAAQNMKESRNGFQDGYRRSAECGQIDPVQRADADSCGASCQLPLLHN